MSYGYICSVAVWQGVGSAALAPTVVVHQGREIGRLAFLSATDFVFFGRCIIAMSRGSFLAVRALYVLGLVVTLAFSSSFLCLSCCVGCGKCTIAECFIRSPGYSLFSCVVSCVAILVSPRPIFRGQ